MADCCHGSVSATDPLCCLLAFPKDGAALKTRLNPTTSTPSTKASGLALTASAPPKQGCHGNTQWGAMHRAKLAAFRMPMEKKAADQANSCLQRTTVLQIACTREQRNQGLLGKQQRCMEDTLTQPTSRGKNNSPSFSRALELTACSVSQEFWFQPILPFTHRVLEIILQHIINISKESQGDCV